MHTMPNNALRNDVDLPACPYRFPGGIVRAEADRLLHLSGNGRSLGALSRYVEYHTLYYIH